MPFSVDQTNAIQLIAAGEADKAARETRQAITSLDSRIEDAVAKKFHTYRAIAMWSGFSFAGLLSGALVFTVVTLPDRAAETLKTQYASLAAIASQAANSAISAEMKAAAAEVAAAAATAQARATTAAAIAAQDAANDIMSTPYDALREQVTLIKHTVEGGGSALRATLDAMASTRIQYFQRVPDSNISVRSPGDFQYGVLSGGQPVVPVSRELEIEISSPRGAIVAMSFSGLCGPPEDKRGGRLSDAHLRFWLIDESGAIVRMRPSGQDAVQTSDALSTASYYRQSDTPGGWQPVVLTGFAQVPSGNYRVSPGYYTVSGGVQFHAVSFELLMFPIAHGGEQGGMLHEQ